MTPEEKTLLEETAELVKKNNTLLHKLHRAAVWSSIMSSLYWVAIIGATVGAYYVFQPYIDALKESYSTIQTGIEGLPDISSLLNVKGSE